MRFFLLTLSVLAWAMPALAATTYVVPITVVPGSVVFSPFGDLLNVPPFSVTFPISEQVVSDAPSGACDAGAATVNADIVNGGLEIELDGFAEGGGCLLGGNIEFEVEIAVPELGGTTTVVRLVPEVLTFVFADYRHVEFESIPSFPVSSSIPDFAIDDASPIQLFWDGTSSEPQPTIQPQIRATNWIPGDTVRFKWSIRFQMNGKDADPAQGIVRTRYEYRVTVPEPSAALSLPIGVLGLAALAAMKGNG